MSTSDETAGVRPGMKFTWIGPPRRTGEVVLVKGKQVHVQLNGEDAWQQWPSDRRRPLGQGRLDGVSTGEASQMNTINGTIVVGAPRSPARYRATHCVCTDFYHNKPAGVLRHVRAKSDGDGELTCYACGERPAVSGQRCSSRSE